MTVTPHPRAASPALATVGHDAARSAIPMKLAAIILLMAACYRPHAVVPVRGDADFLAGEWHGSFESHRYGRFGTIVFKLDAGKDSAWGDVTLTLAVDAVPPPLDGEADPILRLKSVPLSIAFVAFTSGTVTGRLDPYYDPETGSEVQTTFQGRLAGDELVGTYDVLVVGTKKHWTGDWAVKRRRTTRAPSK